LLRRTVADVRDPGRHERNRTDHNQDGHAHQDPWEGAALTMVGASTPRAVENLVKSGKGHYDRIKPLGQCIDDLRIEVRIGVVVAGGGHPASERRHCALPDERSLVEHLHGYTDARRHGTNRESKQLRDIGGRHLLIEMQHDQSALVGS
jgi:hypothetical protein